MDDVKITIIVLNHSKAFRVIENVKYLMTQEAGFRVKVFVIDNSCDKEQAKILKTELQDQSNVELMINSKNLGYAKGYNVIKGKEEGDYVFVVNPDILLKEKDSLQKMVNYMDLHPNIAILGPKQINDDGKIAMTVRAFPKLYLQIARRTFLRKLPFLKDKVAYDEMSHLDYSKIQDVDWLQSSCVIIRRDFWEKIGGFNELYFLFMADTEMSRRAWEMGYRVVYYPETQVYADGKRLSAGGFFNFFQSRFVRQHVIDSIKYRLKYFWRNNPRRK